MGQPAPPRSVFEPPPVAVTPETAVFRFLPLLSLSLSLSLVSFCTRCSTDTLAQRVWNFNSAATSDVFVVSHRHTHTHDFYSPKTGGAKKIDAQKNREQKRDAIFLSVV